MAADRRLTAPVLYELGPTAPSRGSTSAELTPAVPVAQVGVPDIAPLPSTPRGFWGNLRYDVQTRQVEDATRTVGAVEDLIRSKTSLEQAMQAHALQVAKRDLLPILALASKAEAEGILFTAFANRARLERCYLAELRARDADGHAHDRIEAIAAHDHALAINGKRQELVSRPAAPGKDDEILRLLSKMWWEMQAQNRLKAPGAPEEDAPEFAAAFAEEERRAAIERTAQRRKNEVLRGKDSETSKREQLERINQATARALKQYDLGQAGILMPDDEEE